MAKSIVLSNGSMMVGLDQFGQVYDFYYPFVGLENHTKGRYVHKIGVRVGESFSWLDDGSWQISTNYKKETMVSDIEAVNHDLGIKLNFEDAIYNEKNIFVRQVKVKNLNEHSKEIKVFFNQQFIIYESGGGDTALYDHSNDSIVHYKGRRVFMIDLESEGKSFDDYSVGLLGIEGREGTYKDAEDGDLKNNNVEHGSVDSTIGVYFYLDGGKTRIIDYWITVAKTIPKAKELSDIVKKRGVKALIDSTAHYWQAWIKTNETDFGDLPQKYIDLYKKSLLIVSAHTGTNGSIIASGDSDLLKHGRDAYAYVWSRDGALIARSMNKAGYHFMVKHFLDFCTHAITDEGFMLHKYRADGTLGSSWHPWVRNFKSELPIQEDETALVLITLWDYYETTKDIEFVEKNYEKLVKNPANFMVNYMNSDLNLPNPTYDLWEEKFGTSTFTSSTVYKALICAGNFADLLGKVDQRNLFYTTAESIKKGILEHLYDEKLGYFVKHLICDPSDYGEEDCEQDSVCEDNFKNHHIIYDTTIDSSSLYGILEYGVLDYDNTRVVSTVNKIREKLTDFTEVGGVCRYYDDYYFRTSQDTPGNPWIITTLWLARYEINIAKDLDDLKPVYEKLDWVLKYSQKSGVLSEQLNPYTGEQLSASPLTWSHAEYVETIIELLKKKEELK